MRYIDADKLVEMCKRQIECEWNTIAAPNSWADAFQDFSDLVEQTPTADVVPKSEVDMSQHLLKDAWKRIEELDELCGELQKSKTEVAREIFEEIEKLLECGFSSCHINGTEEQFDFYRADLGFQLAELKKKYTEDE